MKALGLAVVVLGVLVLPTSAARIIAQYENAAATTLWDSMRLGSIAVPADRHSEAHTADALWKLTPLVIDDPEARPEYAAGDAFASDPKGVRSGSAIPGAVFTILIKPLPSGDNSPELPQIPAPTKDPTPRRIATPPAAKRPLPSHPGNPALPEGPGPGEGPAPQEQTPPSLPPPQGHGHVRLAP
ncbi:hypothetical protein [Mycobacterium sp.]|uniref:hypothetical protein n=1 Tax=Mycobacterium sp. TaxID=1785 RepID=UPI0012898BC4|nr:hypothetical protein [Mycobacterium sp.]KAA8965841.1 MAG: hypothetical protein F6Q13_08175 [Mycobacterium sp.]